MASHTTWSQRLLALFFVGAGAMHFVAPAFYRAMMPKILPESWAAPLVVFTGLCEIAGGLGVLVPRVRALTGVCLLLLLVAVFPANVQMLMNARDAHASAGTIAGLSIRLPIQLLLLWWVWRATRRSPRAVAPRAPGAIRAS